MDTDANGDRGFAFSSAVNSLLDGFTFDYKKDHIEEIELNVGDVVIEHDSTIPVDEEAAKNLEGNM